MSNLDATIARLRALPKQQQEVLAAQIDQMLDEGAEDLLTPEQWAEIEARLDRAENFTPHENVLRAFRDRFRWCASNGPTALGWTSIRRSRSWRSKVW